MKGSIPTLSIIIPTFNSGTTLSVALESIRSQTFEELEIIIMDGLSGDNTLQIARSYVPIFQDLTIISEEDKGIYDAMNKGIEMAKGEWLYFMGSDDSFYNSEILEKFFALKAVNTHDVIYGNVFSSRFEHPYDGKFSYYKLAIKNICHQSIFFRKNVFSKVGKFNLDYKIWADWDHNIRWFYSSRIKKYYINEIIANYADGGFSSLNEDSVFIKEKNYKLLKEGFNKLPPAQRRDVCNLALAQAEKDGDFLRASILKAIKFALKIDKFLAQKIK